MVFPEVEVFLTEKQVEKIMKKAIFEFSSNWKPDHTSFTIPYDKEKGVTITVECREAYKSLDSGSWVMSFNQEGKQLAIKLISAPSLTSILKSLVRIEKTDKIKKSINTQIGTFNFTDYQVNKILGYLEAVNNGDVDGEKLSLSVELVHQGKKVKSKIQVDEDWVYFHDGDKSVKVKTNSFFKVGDNGNTI